MSAPALLIHVGLHKTGTSWLQKHVFAARHGRELIYCGDTARLYRQFILPALAEFSPERARAAFAPLLAEAAARGLPVLMSGENLAGRPFHARFQREIVAARLAETYPEARILLTIREQDAVIRSMYGQYLRFGYTSSLAAFLAEPAADAPFQPVLDRQFYDYDALFDCYADLFGADRVLLVPFESMLADPAALIARLSAALAAPLAPLDPGTGGRQANPALSDMAYGLLRLLNRFDSQDSRWQRRGGANAMAHRFDRLVPSGLSRAAGRRSAAAVRAALGDRYAASNGRLARRLDLDLGALGYRMPRPSEG